jgi:hypothetical protein
MTAKTRARPRRVYKYRAFNTDNLEALVLDMLHFSDPSTFNDPLDAQPTLETDLPAAELERIFRMLVEERVAAEMKAAAKAIRSRSPGMSVLIAKRATQDVERLVADILYGASDPEFEMEDPDQYLFGQHIEREVLRRYDRGIVSLAQRADCPLMWSHYGDQHHGICIGYSAPEDVALWPVSYGGSRGIKASLVRDMVDGDEAAARRVDEAVLLKKAQAWRYEKEWRLIGDRGLRDSPLEMEEIVFGMRCPLAVQFAIVKAFAGRQHPPKFYEIRETTGTFLLCKVVADTDEMLATWPRRARDIHDWFADVSLPDDEAQGSSDD